MQRIMVATKNDFVLIIDTGNWQPLWYVAKHTSTGWAAVCSAQRILRSLTTENTLVSKLEGYKRVSCEHWMQPTEQWYG